MSKGLTFPLVVIFIAFLLAAPFGYYFLYAKNALNTNVKGAQTELPKEGGLYVSITSKNGTWDLNQYLCETNDRCSKELTAGIFYGTISGGETDAHKIKIEPADTWQNYKYLKLFMKPGWGSISRNFSANVYTNAESDTIQKNTTTYENAEYTVVLIPVSELNSSTGILVEFKDSL